MPLVWRTTFLAPTVYCWPTQFLGFACFEFSLKASGFACNRQWGAQLDCEIKRVENGRALLIPASDSTAGHGTTGIATFYEREPGELSRSAPRLAPQHRTREGHP